MNASAICEIELKVKSVDYFIQYTAVSHMTEEKFDTRGRHFSKKN